MNIEKMDPSIANDPRFARLPLPNSIRCPALELFRKYHYPDAYALSCFTPETAKVLEQISKVMVEPRPNALEWKPKPIDNAIHDGSIGSQPAGTSSDSDESTSPGLLQATAEPASKRSE